MLSILMPVYNELGTVEQAINEVLATELPTEIELIVVDDGSTDGTRELLGSKEWPSAVTVLHHERNAGKGAAVLTALQHAGGEFAAIFDADLEYDPGDLPALLEPIRRGHADAVYGSRFQGGPHRVLFFWHAVGNHFLTLMSNMFTNLNLSDMETCYKLVRRELLLRLPLTSDRFGFEVELTARLSQVGARIWELPISYSGRTYAEGKKIGWRDGVRAMFCIAAYAPLGERLHIKRLSPLVGRLTRGRA